MSMPKALIASYLEPDLIDLIRQEVPEVEVIYHPELLGMPRYQADHTAPVSRNPEQETQWRALLSEAEILFDFDFSHREDLPEIAPKLRWIQATSAGIGQYVKRMGYAQQTDWVFTTASGVHARPLAEFVLMAMLVFAKDYAYLQREQANQHWQRYCGSELAGKTLAIVGLGKIGREIAKLAKALDMHVIGNRRTVDTGTPQYVDQVFDRHGLASMLSRADFLALSCPHTPETEGLIGADELAMLPPHAILINIARGKVVNQEALVTALQSGKLRGAALDVFDPEPLPEGHVLWTMPNVIISPHSASTADSENEKITRLFCANLKRYLADEPLINLLDTEHLY
jgi:glyoxylate/hydroxypyruvate reductase A